MNVIYSTVNGIKIYNRAIVYVTEHLLLMKMSKQEQISYNSNCRQRNINENRHELVFHLENTTQNFCDP